MEPRIIKRTATRIPAMYAGESAHGSGYVKNMTREGLFLRTDVLPRPGESVNVVFYLPEGGTIEIRGSVCWTTEEVSSDPKPRPGFGMRIEDSDSAYLAFYEELLTCCDLPRRS